MGEHLKDLLPRNLEAHSLKMIAAMSSGHYINPANQAPGVLTGHASGIYSSHRLIIEKKKISDNVKIYV